MSAGGRLDVMKGVVFFLVARRSLFSLRAALLAVLGFLFLATIGGLPPRLADSNRAVGG